MRKGYGSQGASIDRTTDPEFAKWLQDLLAEPFEHPIAAGTLFEQGVADLVGIEQKPTQTGEGGGDQALAGPDSTDQPDNRNRTVPPGASGSATRSGLICGGAGHDGSIHAR